MIHVLEDKKFSKNDHYCVGFSETETHAGFCFEDEELKANYSILFPIGKTFY